MSKYSSLVTKACIAIGSVLLGISAMYYGVVYLPMKEKNDLQRTQLAENIRLEEIKLEQSRIQLEGEKIQQEKRVTEAEKLAEEEKRQTAPLEVKSSNTSGLNACLGAADEVYNGKLKEEKMCSKDYYCDKAAYAAIVSNLQNEKNQARNECYMKYR